jgi:hypothetical protein
MAAQMQEAPIPDHLLTLTTRDDRAQVVVDALARHATQPLERPHVPFEERLDRHVEREERRLRARVRKRGNQRVNATLAAGEPRPGRHLRPLELQHLPRPVAGPLRRPHSRRPKLTQPPLDQIHRTHVAVLVAQQLGRPRRLDLRPLLEQTTQHRLERIELRGRRRSPITQRLLAPRQPGNRALLQQFIEAVRLAGARCTSEDASLFSRAATRSRRSLAGPGSAPVVAVRSEGGFTGSYFI